MASEGPLGRAAAGERAEPAPSTPARAPATPSPRASAPPQGAANTPAANAAAPASRPPPAQAEEQAQREPQNDPKGASAPEARSGSAGQAAAAPPAHAAGRETPPAKAAPAAPIQAIGRAAAGPTKDVALPGSLRAAAQGSPRKGQLAPGAPEPRADSAAAQFSRGLSAALRQGGGTVTLRLSPENLGDLKIKLEMEAGKVAAQFRVETVQARQLLDESLGSLRSALEARGLEVQSLSVHVAERTTPAPEARGQPEHSWNQGTGGHGSPQDGAQQNTGGGGAAHHHGAGQRRLGRTHSGPAGMPPGPFERPQGTGPVAAVLHLRLDAIA
jgi:flagellar hook-length control protein FliK